MKAISLRACWVALFVGVGALVAVPTVVDAQAKKETAPAKEEKKPAAKKERTAKSKECSAEADKRGLKGKERRKFRAKCKRGTAS